MIFVSGSIKIIIRSFFLLLLLFFLFFCVVHTHCRLLLFLIAHILHRQRFLMNTGVFHRSEDLFCVAIAAKFSPKPVIHMTDSVFLLFRPKTLLYKRTFVSFSILYRKLSVLSRSRINLFRKAAWIHHISDHTQYEMLNESYEMKPVLFRMKSVSFDLLFD